MPDATIAAPVAADSIGRLTLSASAARMDVVVGNQNGVMCMGWACMAEE